MSGGGLISDLGRLSGPLLVFGGPYSNLSATREMMDRADLLGIPAGARICTGDVVAYCAQAEETVAQVRTRAGPVIAGNVEAQLAQSADDCGCGFKEGSACDLLSAGWYPYANRAVSWDTRGWMAGLPDLLVFTHAGHRCAVLHGGVSDISRFLWPTSRDEDFARELALLSARVGPVDRVYAGHCGIPFRRQVGDVDWVNAGVIGMPPNDGSPATRFVVVGADGAVSIRLLHYDPAPSALAMEQAGLTQGYDRALLTGWWPSEDVLPANLRRERQSAEPSLSASG